MDDLILVTEAFEYHCKNLEGVTKTHYRKKCKSDQDVEVFLEKTAWKNSMKNAKKKFNNEILTYQSIFGVIELWETGKEKVQVESVRKE